MGDFKKLGAWQKANDLAVAIHHAFQERSAGTLTGLRGQIMRSAGSIADNLAEACGRRSQADFERFCDQAYGSAKEVENQLIRAHRIGALSSRAFSSLNDQIDEISRLCFTLSGRKKRGDS
jgi:four helix bundle protein